MHTAQLEFLFGSQLKGLMASKERKWEALKRDGAERMGELSSFFSGAKELTRVKRDARLEKWFATLKEVIESLDHRDSTLAGRKIQQLMSALDDVGQFHQVEDNASVKLFLTDAILQLKQMIRLVNIKEVKFLCPPPPSPPPFSLIFSNTSTPSARSPRPPRRTHKFAPWGARSALDLPSSVLLFLSLSWTCLV